MSIKIQASPLTINVHAPINMDGVPASTTTGPGAGIAETALRTESMRSTISRAPRGTNLPLAHTSLLPVSLTPPEPQISRSSLWGALKDRRERATVALSGQAADEVSVQRYSREAVATMRIQAEIRAKQVHDNTPPLTVLSTRDIVGAARTEMAIRIPIGKKSSKSIRDAAASRLAHLTLPPALPSPVALRSITTHGQGMGTLAVPHSPTPLTTLQREDHGGDTAPARPVTTDVAGSPSRRLVPGELVNVILTPSSRLENRELIMLTLTEKPAFLSQPVPNPLPPM